MLSGEKNTGQLLEQNLDSKLTLKKQDAYYFHDRNGILKTQRALFGTNGL